MMSKYKYQFDHETLIYKKVKLDLKTQIYKSWLLIFGMLSMFLVVFSLSVSILQVINCTAINKKAQFLGFILYCMFIFIVL